MGDAAERLDVLFRFLLDHVGDVVEGDDADQPVVGVDHRRRHQIVALEQPRHFLLILVGVHLLPFGLHQIGDRHRALGAQQTIERHGAEKIPVFVGNVKLVEVLRQFGGLPHIVDRLADVPGRRHGDEIRLHAPAGGVFRIVETALEHDALGRRQLREDLGLLVLRQIFEDRHRVVGFEFTHAFCHGLRRQLFEDFFAHRVIDLGERGEVEVDAEQFDQARPLLRFERLDHGAEVGDVQSADQPKQRVDVGCFDGLDHLAEIPLADGAIIVARQRSDFPFGHAWS